MKSIIKEFLLVQFGYEEEALVELLESQLEGAIVDDYQMGYQDGYSTGYDDGFIDGECYLEENN